MRKVHLCLGVLALIMLGACNNNDFRHTGVRPNFFEQKKDLRMSVDMSSLIGLTGAYALTDHVAIAGSLANNNVPKDTAFLYDTLQTIISQQIRSRNVSDFEFSGGYFTKLGEKKKFTLEIFGGGGVAFNKDKLDLLDVGSNVRDEIKNPFGMSYYRFYIQPSFGKNSRFFDYGVTTRIQFISYPSTGLNDLIIEPVLFARVGVKRLKFMVQGGGVIPIIQAQSDFSPITISGGIQYLHQAQKKKLDDKTKKIEKKGKM